MEPRLVLSAGIPRSGSTWLYNAVRLLLSAGGHEGLEAAWIEDYDPESPAALHLVKLHEPAPALLEKSSLVLTSRRDLRDIACSVRRMDWAKSDEDLLAFLEGVVAQHLYWAAAAAHETVYEAMVADRLAEMARIAKALGLSPDQQVLGEVAQHIDRLEHDPGSGDTYDKLSLLHHAHRGGGGVSAYPKELSADLARRIEDQFGDWLSAQGYL
jgi:hypothetical protein